MKIKNLFKTFAIILGVITLFSFTKVQAVEGVFYNEILTRSNVQPYNTTAFSSSTTLGISKKRESGNWYVWNPTTDALQDGKVVEDDNGNVQAKKVWKIATYSDTTTNTVNYNDLYYCLNAERGFVVDNGGMAEGAKDEYKSSFDMKDTINKNKIVTYAGENLEANYDKILWILDNSYVPAGADNYQASDEYINLMKKADIKIDNNEELNLTEDDIEVVQQMAIWYYTNSTNELYNNENLPSLYLNGVQLSSIYYGTDQYGSQITGAKRQDKADKLYKYFIKKAPEVYTRVEPELTLPKSTAMQVKELGNFYVAGPLEMSKSNVSVTGLTVKINNTELENTDYLIVSSENGTTNITDYNNLNNFYLKINKNKILSNSKITIAVNGEYSTKTLTFFTDASDAEKTQPVVLVKEETKDINSQVDINTNITEIIVIKEWADESDKDAKRPTSIKVQLYKDGELYGENIQLNNSNNWTYTWDNLLGGFTYTVKELKQNGEVIEDGGKYNEDYITTYNVEGNTTTITNTHTPEEITGQYKVILRKVDENGSILKGSEFKIKETNYQLTDGEAELLEYTQILSTDSIILNYDIEETKAPEGYNGIEKTSVKIKAEIKQEENSYKLDKAFLVDSEDNSITNENISVKVEGNVIVIEVKNTRKEENKFDLSLRKFITKVNDISYSREPKVDTTKLGTKVDGKVVTTATYTHSKEPIVVQKGDVVTYTIRVYNEGEVDGYVNQITDHLPDHLLPIIEGVEGVDSEKYKDEIDFNSNWLWQYFDEGKTVTTTITSKSNSEYETYSILTGLEEISDTKLDAYVEGSDKLDYIDVQIKCLVTDNAVSSDYLTNIAEITKMCDVNGVEVETDRDSTKSNADISNISNYKNKEAIESDKDSYIPGQEDDDDFEKLIVQEFDLALRKFITKVNEVSYSREPKVDTTKLGTTVDGKLITTATYTHSKEPVIVETNDIVTYAIRIYNEGTLAGYANEITDNIPEGLEFLPNSEVNTSYKWKMLDKDGNETTNVSEAVMITTEYLADKNNIINSVSEQDGVKTLSYKDVEVQFKVTAKPEKLKENIIINEAQISSDSDRDIDSEPNRDEKYDYTSGNNEDDIDYEPIKLQYYDLALRKFVTKVNSTQYNNRYPEIKFNEDGSITYNHTKDPVLVTTNDTVVYTIRVYNEGEKAGYATEIIDNLPEGLEFIVDNEINKEYGWKLLDSEGNVTEDVTKATKFTTDSLKNELIDALVVKDGSKILSYKDVQIAFKVVEPNTSDRILINTAEISNDSDEDIDSVPGNSVLTEDDIDKEYVKVQYFDLSLKKWVTSSQVTYNGKTTTTKTEFKEDSDDIAKVDLVASKMNKTTVKFTYNIKVTNEGELPGYAYEVKDYIPKGLKFVAEDNKDWKELEDGVVVTEKLKDTLLNPGESATVEIVLTWKNSTTNTGLKTNYAEISKDSAEDYDSMPDNYDFTEDDMDDAQVILSIKTAGARTYIGLALITVAILAGGIFLIRKYVIK